MTRDQIIAKWESLSPRERDAWVAEVVFERPNVHFRYGRPVYDNVGYINGKPSGNVMGTVDVPEYTTDISAAWAVLEEVRKGHFVEITDCAPFGWRVDLENDGEEMSRFHAVKESAPEAIGLAAIIAKLTTKG